MISRIHRLNKGDFDEVLNKGKVIHSPLFLVRILIRVSTTPGPARIAAVAPVKIAKTAVLRNKTKRRIYEAVSTFMPEIKNGASIIIFAKAPALTVDHHLVADALREAFVKAGLLR